MSKYAEDTTVTEDQSQLEIKRTIARYGGDLPTFGWGRDEYTASVGFRIAGRFIRMDLELLRPTDPDIAQDSAGRLRTGQLRQAALLRERRRRWRVLGACKAKRAQKKTAPNWHRLSFTLT